MKSELRQTMINELDFLDKIEEIQENAYENNIGSNEEQLEVRTEIIKLLRKANFFQENKTNLDKENKIKERLEFLQKEIEITIRQIKTHVNPIIKSDLRQTIRDIEREISQISL